MANEVNPSKEKIMMSNHENVECQGITDNKEKMIDVDENNEYIYCKNCNWTGKINALLKHLRMKPSCTSKYNMESVYDEQATHKKLRKQHYDKMQYAKMAEKKRQYYQENKAKRKAYQTDYDDKHRNKKQKYYADNKEERKDYQNMYYEENKDQRLEYQRHYDREHKQKKKEYKKLMAHYRKYANRMLQIFQTDDMRHFKSHVTGWCNWTKRSSSHDHCWEEVLAQCNWCNIGLFKLKSNGKGKPYEINALHCISCTQVVCHLCGEDVQEYDYYLHFYINGINSAMMEIAKMCPFRTYLNIATSQRHNFPCEKCSDSELQGKRKEYVERVGIKYVNFLNMKTFEQTSIVSNAGRDILVCPHTKDDVKSTICLRDAVTKLENKVNNNIKRNDEKYIELHYKYTGTLKHQTKFDLLCEHKKHMDLHENRKVESHVLELTLAEAYSNENDLKTIDTLLKTNMENFEQVSEIRAIIGAECLGFKDHRHDERQEAWLAVVDPKYLTVPVKAYPDTYHEEDPEINSQMIKLKEEMKTVYMIIQIYEGSLDNPVEYFEKLPLYPEWIKQSKLLFTWTVKDILMEENKLIQKSLIRAEFIQSKRYPSYLMNLANAPICSCDCCLSRTPCATYDIHTIPMNGCSLPMKRSPLHEMTLPKQSELELWYVMFKFAWKEMNKDVDSETDTEIAYDSDSSEIDDNRNETEDSEDMDDSDDFWPDL